MNTRYIPPARPVTSTSGAFKKPASPATERIDDGRLYAARTSLLQPGFFSGFISIEGMPHGGATFIDGTRTDDSRSQWADASFRRWIVTTGNGGEATHEVVVVAPNGERRVGQAATQFATTPGGPPSLTWATMKVLPPVNPVLGGYGDGIVRASGFVRPSGAVPDRNTIMQLQLALMALGHTEAGQVTGTMPIATRAQLLSFQRNYNAENRCRRREAGAPCQPGRVYGAPYQPARIAEDGEWGPNTQAALTNYVPFAQSAMRDAVRRQTATAAPPSPNDVMGWGGAPGPDTSLTPLKTPRQTTAVTPAPSSTPAATTRPAPTPAPPQELAPSEPFPTGPLLAVVAGAAVLAGAVWYRRGSRKSKGR